jgi:hypothetical protein
MLAAGCPAEKLNRSTRHSCERIVGVLVEDID